MRKMQERFFIGNDLFSRLDLLCLSLRLTRHVSGGEDEMTSHDYVECRDKKQWDRVVHKKVEHYHHLKKTRKHQTK